MRLTGEKDQTQRIKKKKKVVDAKGWERGFPVFSFHRTATTTLKLKQISVLDSMYIAYSIYKLVCICMSDSSHGVKFYVAYIFLRNELKLVAI